MTCSTVARLEAEIACLRKERDEYMARSGEMKSVVYSIAQRMNYNMPDLRGMTNTEIVEAIAGHHEFAIAQASANMQMWREAAAMRMSALNSVRVHFDKVTKGLP